MLTANAVSGQKELFLKSGLNDFLAKPIGVQKLDEILRTWLPEEKQVPASEPLAEKSGDDTAAISIEGVDTERGLALAGGSTTAYRKVLAVFCDDVGERLPRIKAEAANADPAPYTITVHALKGAARSIGAVETGELAAELEDAGKTGNHAVIAEKTGAFLERLELLRFRISAALELRSLERGSLGPGETGEGAPGYASIDLRPLKEALSAMDTESVNTQLLSYRALPLEGNAKTLISEIERYVLLFEYEKAVEKIDQVLAV
jgi:HPt (histidine-containing phosphotransfer) domain-containing protein